MDLESRPDDKRQFGRVRLDPPIAGDVSGLPVMLHDISVRGGWISHSGRLPQSARHRLRFRWHQSTITLAFAPVRSTLVRAGAYETAFRIVDHLESMEALRELIADHVVHAINEQLANARGVPPMEMLPMAPAKTSRFRRMEFQGEGKWRRHETTSPDQPFNGFTVSADVDPYLIAVLCRTWEACDAEGRKLTQLLAELSISESEGAAIRRYIP
jgi:hypothetical protein